MSLISDYMTINYNNLYFSTPIKNNIKENSLFYKLLYSDECIVLKNLYFKLIVKPVKIHLESSRAVISMDRPTQLQENIYDIEKSILHQFNSYINASGDKRYTPCYSITDQVSSGSIRIYNITNIYCEKEMNILLKVSGVWVTKNNIGITYKFIYSNN